MLFRGLDACEMEINGRHLGFKDGGYDVPKSQWQNRIPRCKNVGVGVKIVILCYSEAEIHDI